MGEPVLWSHNVDGWVVPVTDKFNPDVMSVLGFLDRSTMEITFVDGYEFDPDRSALALSYVSNREYPNKILVRQLAVVPRDTAIFEQRLEDIHDV